MSLESKAATFSQKEIFWSPATHKPLHLTAELLQRQQQTDE
jgi:hypothetical protein